MQVQNPALRRMAGQDRFIPDPITAMVPMWEKMAEDSASQLEKIIGCTVQPNPIAMILSDSVEMAAAHPEPGLLIPLKVSEKEGYYVRISSTDLLTLSTKLLRTTTSFERDAMKIGPLDDLLVRHTIEAVLTAIAQSFNISIGLEEERESMKVWPFAAPGESTPYLIALFRYVVDKDYPVQFEVTLPPDSPEFRLAEKSQPEFDTSFISHLMGSSAQVSVILDQWESSPGEVSSLDVGSILRLPNGSMDNLSLSISGEDRLRTVATGEHGRSGRSQAIRLTKINDGFH